MRGRKKNVTGRVGEFFTYLTHSVVGGEVVEWEYHGSDIENQELCFEVEVKASTNNKHFRLSASQKARYLNKVPFPLDYFLYALCSYQGQEWRPGQGKQEGSMQSRMSRCKTKDELFRVLAEWTDEVYLFDIEVIDAFEKILGTSTGRYAGDSARKQVLVLERTKHIRPLWNGHRQEFFANIGLNSADWKLGKIDLERSFFIQGKVYTVKFALFTILRPAFHRRLLRSLGHPPNRYRYQKSAK
jgi:hypothetical protein